MKTNKKLILIVFCLILCGGVAFYFFEINNRKNNSVNKETEELDINSRLVQELYSMISPKGLNNSMDADWMYNDSSDDRTMKSYNVSDNIDMIKMNLVGSNLNVNNAILLPCSSDIPDNMGNYGSSVCKHNKDKNDNIPQYGYSREYVEMMYKRLYGSSEELNTNLAFRTSQYSNETYVYISKIDMYVLYSKEDITTIKPGGYEFILEKASKNDKKILLNVKVEKKVYKQDTKSFSKEANYNFVYTFKLDNDGLYSFVGRELID